MWSQQQEGDGGGTELAVAGGLSLPSLGQAVQLAGETQTLRGLALPERLSGAGGGGSSCGCGITSTR